MPVCVPVRDMKNTAEFTSLVEREGDITVTKNGYDAFHCLADHEYRALRDEAVKARLFSRIMLAEQEIENGNFSDFQEFAEEIRAEYDL